MTYAEVKNKIGSLDFEELDELKNFIEETIATRLSNATKSVKMTKLGDGKYELNFNGVMYEAVDNAYHGRWRLYTRVPAKKGGFKRGKVVVHEYLFGLTDLRREIAFGVIK